MRKYLPFFVAAVLLVSVTQFAVAQDAHTVAGKTYNVFTSPSFTPPGTPPFNDCVRFGATTMEIEGCAGTTGTLSEFPIFGIPSLTLWIGFVPCEIAVPGGLNILWFGTSFDGSGLPGGLGQDTMSATGWGLTENSTFATEGKADPACTVLPAQSLGNRYSR